MITQRALLVNQGSQLDSIMQEYLTWQMPVVTRNNGRYSLTSFGRIVYEAQLLIGKAKQNFWKLRAIDSVCSSAHGLPSEERSKIIETFLAEEDLKEILLGRNKTNLVEKQPLIAQSRQPPAFWILYSWIFNLVHSEYIQVSRYPAASTSFRTVVSADHRSGLGPRTGHQGQ